MPSILPKGIVVNTREISGDIERIDREPLAAEEIAKLWKVYTTTRRRLLDPTAERLENYWWRLWGSRKRHLSGATVARLFAHISDGTSFVPLRGPRERDESGGQLGPSLHRGPGTASTTAMHFSPESQSSSGPQLSSSSKMTSAMPPPILKKSRGPSSTGPRPTARFISPHSSEEEEVARNVSSTSLGARVVVRPPTPELQVSREEKMAESSSAGPRRKAHQFPASNAGHKRRSGVVRRPNSDPINQANEAARAEPSNIEFSDLTDMTGHRKDLGKLQSDYQSQESSSPSPNSRQEGKSARKIRPSKKGQPKVHSGPGSASKSAAHETAGRGSTAALQPATPVRVMPPDGEKQELLLKENKSPRDAAPNHPSQPTGAGPNNQRSLDFKSSISLASTHAAASGNLDFRSPPVSASADDQESLDAGEGGSGDARASGQTSLFAKRSVQPAKSASALFASSSTQREDPISRSKSQLTLLLEKDRVKAGESRRKLASSSKAKEPETRE